MLIKENMKYIKYTINHRKAFRKIEKQLTGRVSLRGLFHDFDKIFLYMIFEKAKAHNIHRNWSRHHANKAHTHKDYIQMVIDWECARFTKPDKPLNARDTLKKYYSNLTDKVLPVIEELGL